MEIQKYWEPNRVTEGVSAEGRAFMRCGGLGAGVRGCGAQALGVHFMKDCIFLDGASTESSDEGGRDGTDMFLYKARE